MFFMATPVIPFHTGREKKYMTTKKYIPEVNSRGKF